MSKKRKKTKGDVSLDFTANITVQMAGYEWDEHVACFEEEDDPVEAALAEIASSLEGEDINTYYGNGWLVYVDGGSVV